MKEYILLLLCLTVVSPIYAQVFAEYFTDKILRAGCIFSDDASQQNICLGGLSSLPTWAGRRHHLAKFPLQDSGQIVMRDAASEKTTYTASFSSLFQKWLETNKAKSVTKGFENTFLPPYPLQPTEIEVILLGLRRNIHVSVRHTIHPSDALIAQKGSSHVIPHKCPLQNGDADKYIDVAILTEGYTPQKIQTFYRDAGIAYESLLTRKPFRSMKRRFNIVAVANPSTNDGVNAPRLNEQKHTALSSHFSTFYSDRYLTTSRVRAVYDTLAGVPHEYITMLANTEKYGGGGIYNSYILITAYHAMFRPVVVHESGYSPGGLADEYSYDSDIMTDTYPSDMEPWEQNVSTQVDFASKWRDMPPSSVPIPALISASEKYSTDVYEGRGYSAKGIFHPADNCRMRTNEYPEFCPVCQRALRRIINFYTE